MPAFDAKEYIDGQREEWSDAASGWAKWDEWIDRTMSGINSEIVKRASVTKGGSGLDLGSGTGYPAINVAKVVGESGSVTGLDLSEEMLCVARKKAESLGLENIVFNSCDVSGIPFPDENFDSVTSRFCLMFLPDPEKCLGEVLRVMKHGGKAAIVVWASADKNPALCVAFDVLQDYISAQPDPSAPGAFSLGTPGDLAGRMERLGFSEVRETEHELVWDYPSAEIYIERLKDMAAPVRKVLLSLTDEKREEAESRIIENIKVFADGETLLLPAIATVVSGTKGEA